MPPFYLILSGLEAAIIFLATRIEGIGPKYGAAISGWVSLIFFTWRLMDVGLLTLPTREALGSLTAVSLLSLFAIVSIFYVSRNPRPYLTWARDPVKLVVSLGILLNVGVPAASWLLDL